MVFPNLAKQKYTNSHNIVRMPAGISATNEPATAGGTCPGNLIVIL